jgi:hypothetical protein
MMPIWLRNWLESQKQTRKFHPSWIVLVVVVTIAVGSIIWGLAELVAKSEYRPATRHVPVTEERAAQTEGAPATIDHAPETFWFWVDKNGLKKT